MRNGNLFTSCVSEIRVKRIRVSQEIGVIKDVGRLLGTSDDLHTPPTLEQSGMLMSITFSDLGEEFFSLVDLGFHSYLHIR